MSEQKRTAVFEIGVEEMPPWFASVAVANLAERLHTSLQRYFLDGSRVSSPLTFCTSRRLAILWQGLPASVQQRIFGPKKSLCYDSEGCPTKVLLGFTRKMGVLPENLTIPEDIGDKVFVDNELPTAELLKEAFESAVQEPLAPGGAMRWGVGSAHFVRPVRWVLAMLDDRQLDVKAFGLKASNLTRIRSGGSFDALKVEDARRWEGLFKDKVILDPQERRQSIVSQAEARIAEIEDARVEASEELLDEITFLVEQPHVLLCRFDPKYLELPKSVIPAVLEKHQRCLSVCKEESGDLLPYFIAVADRRSSDESVVIAGNEKVVRARLEDALFFFRQDSAEPLETHCKRLEGVQFFADLGTLADKQDRLKSLVSELAKHVPGLTASEKKALKRAAAICKLDQASQMVQEFPLLQGYMAGEYARHSGEEAAVCAALQEQYRMPGLPASEEDSDRFVLKRGAKRVLEQVRQKSGLSPDSQAPSRNAKLGKRLRREVGERLSWVRERLQKLPHLGGEIDFVYTQSASSHVGQFACFALRSGVELSQLPNQDRLALEEQAAQCKQVLTRTSRQARQLLEQGAGSALVYFWKAGAAEPVWLAPETAVSAKGRATDQQNARVFLGNVFQNQLSWLRVESGLIFFCANVSEQVGTLCGIRKEPDWFSLERPQPSSRVGRLLLLADSLDSLCGLFLVGKKKPSSRGDPLGLRRLATRVARLAPQLELNLSPEDMASLALQSYRRPSPKDCASAVAEFIWAQFREVSHRIDGIPPRSGTGENLFEAARAPSTGLYGCQSRLRALFSFSETKADDFARLSVMATRCRGILAQVDDGFTARSPTTAGRDYKTIEREYRHLMSPDAARLPPRSAVNKLERADRELHSVLRKALREVNSNIEAGDYYRALTTRVKITGPVDRLFDEVMVLVPDPDVRETRVQMVRNVLRLFREIAHPGHCFFRTSVVPELAEAASLMRFILEESAKYDSAQLQDASESFKIAGRPTQPFLSEFRYPDQDAQTQKVDRTIKFKSLRQDESRGHKR